MACWFIKININNLLNFMCPRVSIYIPTKNRLNLLQRAVSSVLCQNYVDLEILIVDDGSTDGSRLFLSALRNKYSHVKVFFNDYSYGACYSRNFAINQSTGDFVTGIDDDDYYLTKTRISDFVLKWRDTPGSYAGCFDVASFHDGGIEKKRNMMSVVSYLKLKRCNYVGNQVFAPKQHFVGAGLFDESLPMWQDWDMWIRMSKKYGKFVNLESNSYYVDNSVSNSISKKNEKCIRDTAKYFLYKHDYKFFYEYSFLISAMHMYPQVVPKKHEIFILLCSMRLRMFFNSFFKFLKIRYEK